MLVRSPNVPWCVAPGLTNLPVGQFQTTACFRTALELRTASHFSTVGRGKRTRIKFRDTCKSCGIQISVSINKVLSAQSHAHTCCPRPPSCCEGGAESLAETLESAKPHTFTSFPFAGNVCGPAWRRGVCGVWGRGRWGQAAGGEACGRGCCVLRAGGSCCRVGRQRQVGLPRACPSPQAQSRAAGPEIGQFVTGTWERQFLGQPGPCPATRTPRSLRKQ